MDSRVQVFMLFASDICGDGETFGFDFYFHKRKVALR